MRDPRDAAMLTAIVLGVLRQRARLDHAIARATGRTPEEIEPAVLCALRLGTFSLVALDRIPDHAAVNTAVEIVKSAGHARAAGFVNGVLRRIARDGASLLPGPPARGDVRGLALFRSHPEWWTGRLVERLGWDRADAVLTADNEPAATVLAPGPRAGSPDELASALASEGVAVAPGRLVPGALRVLSGVPQRTRAFREGAFWIQDEGSQLAAGLLSGPVGPRVLDACSAPGGKTLSLAARLVSGGVIVAADRRLKRLGRLAAAVTRVGSIGVVALAADMSRPPLAGAFDDVLVDAPCSGTGTLRRHPEIRWRLRPADLVDLARRQDGILAASADCVRAGGRLVYAVCSMEPEEGEAVIERFLAARADYARVDPTSKLPEAARGLVGADLALRTSPVDHGADGFFAALLTRRSD
jgi:16S rRNA (cytosine967-C5)-methyltransferase